MKLQLTVVVGGATLASYVHASGAHRRHQDYHSHGSVVYVTDWNVATVTDWTTLWGLKNPTATPVSTVLSADSASAVQVSADSSPETQPKAQASAASVGGFEEASGSDSSIASTTLVTSVALVSPLPVLASSPVPSATDVAINNTNTANGFIPNGKKAGLSGYVGIQKLSAFSELAPFISWYSDYTPNPPTTSNVKGVGMLWGANGSPCGSEVYNRLQTFISDIVDTTPEYMFGFYEPDCTCSDSSEMEVSSGAAQWNQYIAPLGKKGSILGSPSMCKQKDEDWLQPFIQGGLDHDWDVTSVHINKPDIQGVMEDIEYYASTYQKPIWVSEFACVHDIPNWQPCTDQDEINQFINDAVNYFQNNDSVVAFGPSNGNGLGNTWPLTDANGKLTQSGQTYLNAIKTL